MPMTQASLANRIRSALEAAQAGGPAELDAVANAIAGAVVAEIQQNGMVTVTVTTACGAGAGTGSGSGTVA